MNDIVQKTVEHGILGLILASVMFGLWKAVAWLGPNFLTPIKDQIVAHLAKLDTAIDAMMALMRGQTESIEKQNSVLSRMDRTIEKTGDETDDNAKVLKRIDTNVEELKRNARQFFHESHAEHERNADKRTQDD